MIGFYIPLERDEGEVRRAVFRLGEAVEQVLQETGMSEEVLASAVPAQKLATGHPPAGLTERVRYFGQPEPLLAEYLGGPDRRQQRAAYCSPSQ